MTANLIGGGLDTSSSTPHTLALALCLFPNVQKAAQVELDSVVGRDRSPGWDDIDHLPYCQAVLKEAMRWRSVTTLGGFAHAPSSMMSTEAITSPRASRSMVTFGPSTPSLKTSQSRTSLDRKDSWTNANRIRRS
jgi:cytochrome P450